jgi:G3E family GTPase
VDQLSIVHEAELVDPTLPGTQTPESEAVQEVLQEVAGNSRYNRKKGRNRLTAKENRAIEMHAVGMAIQHFKKAGWKKVEDVGDKKSYDVHCENGTKTLYVEVKGTTSHGDAVVITRNELQVHREQHPNNALFVVSKIQLERGDEPTASGGEIYLRQPWPIEDADLNPIGYDYKIR